MADRIRILAISAASGRVGYVFIVDGKLTDWAMSRKASKRPSYAASWTKSWIARHKPDVVITEKLDKKSRKSKKTRTINKAIAKVAENADLLDVSVLRIRTFKNKYDEARQLAGLFPEIKAWVPKKPRIWETESRNTIYFEALALAQPVLRDGGQTDPIQ